MKGANKNFFRSDRNAKRRVWCEIATKCFLSEYDLIYQKILDFDRTEIPTTCLRNKHKDVSSDVFNDNLPEGFTITGSFVFNSKFHHYCYLN